MRYGGILTGKELMNAWLWVVDNNDVVYGGFVEKDDNDLFIEDKGKKIYITGKPLLMDLKDGNYWC